MSRAITNSNARLIYTLPDGDDGEAVIGTPEHTELVETYEISPKERRILRKATKRHLRYQRKTEENIDDVQKMANGTDLEGWVMQARIVAAEEKAEQLREKLGRTTPVSQSPRATAQPLGEVSDSFETFGDHNRDVSKGRSRTEEAIITTLNKLMEDRMTVVNGSSLEDILKGIDGATPALAKFTLNKLRGLGVIDSNGRLLKARSGLEEQLKTYLSADEEVAKTSDSVIEHKAGVTLNDEQLQKASEQLTLAIAAYIKSAGDAVDKHQKDGAIRGIESGVIRGFLGPNATGDDVDAIKDQMLEFSERRAKLRVKSETAAERSSRIAEEKAQSKQEAEDAEAAEWAWAGREKPKKPTPEQDAYEELLKTVPNA
jgi:hypothetical protein